MVVWGSRIPSSPTQRAQPQTHLQQLIALCAQVAVQELPMEPTKWESAKVNLLFLGKLSFKWDSQNACDFSVLLFSFTSKVYHVFCLFHTSPSLHDALLKQYIRKSQVVLERSVFSACKCSDKILAATPWRVLAVRTPGIQRLWSWSTFRELVRQNDINDEPGWRIKPLKFHSSFWFLEGLAESSVSMLRSDLQTFVVCLEQFPLWSPSNFHPNFGNNSSSSSPSSNIPSSSNIDYRSMNPRYSKYQYQ